jgi:cytidine deaminase
MDEFDDLLVAAKTARDKAYAPYSGFRVGAAVRDRSGRIHLGCNVENAAFPVGVCAEAAAIAAMIAAGEQKICDILVIGEGDVATPPCGACRQRIVEFADLATRILVADATGVRAVYRCDELLPHAFDSKTLGRTDFEGRND